MNEKKRQDLNMIAAELLALPNVEKIQVMDVSTSYTGHLFAVIHMDLEAEYWKADQHWVLDPDINLRSLGWTIKRIVKKHGCSLLDPTIMPVRTQVSRHTQTLGHDSNFVSVYVQLD